MELKVTQTEYLMLANELPAFTKMMILQEFKPVDFTDATLMDFVRNGDLGEYQLGCVFVNACDDSSFDQFAAIVSEHTKLLELPLHLGEKRDRLQALIV
jgi:hypothetical protein